MLYQQDPEIQFTYKVLLWTSDYTEHYTVGEANPDSLSTIHSTKRVRISLSHCVDIFGHGESKILSGLLP